MGESSDPLLEEGGVEAGLFLAVGILPPPKKNFYKTTSAAETFLVFFFSHPSRNNYVREY